MTMRVTMTQARMGESGSVLAAGSTYTVSDAFGAMLVGGKYATDTDGVLTPPKTVRSVADEVAISGVVSEAGNRTVIIDTDWWTDVDDALAIRVAVWAEKMGLFDIAAVMLDTTLANGPGSLDGLMAYDGRPGVPIGVPATPYVPSGTPLYQANMAGLSARSAGYPASCVDATTLYRTILANLPAGRTLDIISIGYLNNLQALLASPADSISPLTGAQLVAAKVSHLWVVGGAWPSGTENNFARDATAKAAASTVVGGWPTAITFLGYEVGASVYTGGNLVTLGLTTDPIYTALSDFGQGVVQGGRSSWDPMGVLLAAIGDPVKAGYTTVSGTATVAADGSNTFSTASGGRHRYVVKSAGDGYFTDAINSIMVLASQPTRVPVPTGVAPVYVRGALQRTDIGKAQPTVRKSVAGAFDAALLFWYHGDDLADLANAAAVALWPDRMGRLPLKQATVGQRPTYASAKVGRKAVAFAAGSSQRLDSANVNLPGLLTVYVRAEFDAAPAGNMALIVHETAAATARSMHLKVPLNISTQAVNFKSYSTAVSDNANAVAVGTGAWHVHTLTRNDSTVEALYDNTGDGGTAVTGVDGVFAPLSVGGRPGGTEYLTAWISEIRIYSGYHDAAARAAVIADMA